MKEYQRLIEDIFANGEKRQDRTGTGTLSVFGRSLRFDLQKGFPLVTTKNVPFRLPAEEMLWFLKGECNNKQLQDKNITIWDEWADPETGDLGPIYGVQWRNWQKWEPESWDEQEDGSVLAQARVTSIDQVQEAVNMLRTDPYSRRIIVTAWNPSENDQMALPACHSYHQLYCGTDGTVSLMLYMRSSDVALGLVK